MQLNWPCLYMRLSPTLLILGVRLGYQCTLLESILNYKLMIRRQLSHLNHYLTIKKSNIYSVKLKIPPQIGEADGYSY